MKKCWLLGKKIFRRQYMNIFRMLAKYSPNARVYLEKTDKANEKKNKLGSSFLAIEIFLT